MIPADVIRHIESNLSIVDVARKYTDIKKCGARWLGLTPFKKENSPSFVIYPNDNGFYCYSTQQGGGVIKLIQLAENLSFPDAVRSAGRLLGLNITSERKSKTDNQRFDDLRVLNKLATVSHQKLSDSIAADYLNERSIGSDTSEKFLIGFGVNPSTLNQKQAQRIGWISEKGFPYFKNRLLFPISNGKGQIVGFSGRALNGEKPKYINSPSTPYYNKSKTLYGLHQSLNSIRENGVIIVEGYFDVLRLHQIGITNSVAVCGTKLTLDHIRILKQYTSDFTLMFDGDQAGRDATRRASELLLTQGIISKSYELKELEDPDSKFLEEYGPGSTKPFNRDLQN